MMVALCLWVDSAIISLWGQTIKIYFFVFQNTRWSKTTLTGPQRKNGQHHPSMIRWPRSCNFLECCKTVENMKKLLIFGQKDFKRACHVRVENKSERYIYWQDMEIFMGSAWGGGEESSKIHKHLSMISDLKKRIFWYFDNCHKMTTTRKCYWYFVNCTTHKPNVLYSLEQIICKLMLKRKILLSRLWGA